MKSFIRKFFYRFKLVQWIVGTLSIVSGRTKILGVVHLQSYIEKDAIGPLQRDEALALFGLVRTLRPKTIVEFGFFHGHSAFNFLCAMEQDAKIFSYDVSEDSKKKGRNRIEF